MIVRDLPERSAICKALIPGFDYLETRLTGTCDAQYSCVKMLEICRLVRAFDPNFAHSHLDPAYVDSMHSITPLAGHNMLGDLKKELPLYLAAATSAPSFDKADVASYTESILKWWRTNGKSFPAWALAVS